MDQRTVLYGIIGFGSVVVLGLTIGLVVVLWPGPSAEPASESGYVITETPVYYQGISGWSRNRWNGFFLSINERNGREIRGRMHWPRLNMTVAIKGTIEGNQLTFYDYKFVSGNKHPNYTYNEEKVVMLEGNKMYGWDGEDAVIYARKTDRVRYLESVESTVHNGYVSKWGPDYASGEIADTVKTIAHIGVLGALLAGIAVTELWLIVLAFTTNPLWGVGFLLFAPVQFVFCVVHFDKAKIPFLTQLALGLVTLVLFVLV